MRGANILFKDIFDIPVAEKQRQGRSESFDAQRNECLIYRYHYVGIHTGLRYELLLKIIGKEFWLSEVTVSNIITRNHSILIKARKENAERSLLKKRWPQLSWEIPTLQQYDLLTAN